MQGLRAALAIAAAGLIGIASGCGGGDDGNGSVTRTVGSVTLTAPTTSTQESGSTANTGTTGTTGVPSTITLPSGQQIQTSALAPFRDCLERHGVQPLPLDQNPGGFRQLTPDRLRQLGRQIDAQLPAREACAPQLPEPLRSAAERFFQQIRERRQGG